MKLKAQIHFMAVAIVLQLLATGVHAGVHTSELAECLVDSTSRQDRAALVNWLFSAASFHPALNSNASVPGALPFGT